MLKLNQNVTYDNHGNLFGPYADAGVGDVVFKL